jgi:hypothetical protein
MRALLFSLVIVIGIYEGMLFLSFGTLSPCEALSAQVQRIHEQAISELGRTPAPAVLLIPGAQEQLQQQERQALGIPDPDTLLHWVYVLWNISPDDRGSVERAKNMWRAEAEAQRMQ